MGDEAKTESRDGPGAQGVVPGASRSGPGAAPQLEAILRARRAQGPSGVICRLVAERPPAGRERSVSSPLRLDHVVIVVGNRSWAAADYADLGFTATPGGRHTSGPTHNHLIHFVDDRYLELFAPRRRLLIPVARAIRRASRLPGVSRRLPAMTVRFANHMASGEGLADVALATYNLDETVAAVRRRGLAVSDPVEGRATDQDGSELSWRFCAPATRDLPFLIEWAVRRSPPAPQQRTHRNGAVGIRELVVAVESVEASARRYAALLGRGAEVAEGGRVRIDLGDAAITLAEPVSADDPLREHLERRGDGPYALVLGSDAGGPARHLPFAAAHDARLEIRPSSRFT